MLLSAMVKNDYCRGTPIKIAISDRVNITDRSIRENTVGKNTSTFVDSD